MPEKKSYFFSPSTKEQWIDVAKNELNGLHPFEKLTFSIDGITISPYYDQTDVKKETVPLPTSLNPYLGARTWHNLVPVSVTDSVKANKLALTYLNSGADGIFFDLLPNSKATQLVKDIELPYCAVTFRAASNQADFFLDFSNYVQTKENYSKGLTGAIFWQSEPDNLIGICEAFKGCDHFHSCGIHSEDISSPSSEICSLLIQAVKQIDRLTEGGLHIKDAMGTIAFLTMIETDFFTEIAKLKALRWLWHQITCAYDSSFDRPLFIHAYSAAWVKAEYQPHCNMIKSTTAALSAILGGCDGLTVYPEDLKNPLQNRIAKNVSSILREESHLSRVSDPTAGSYYLEQLTDQLAQQAWSKFQKKLAHNPN